MTLADEWNAGLAGQEESYAQKGKAEERVWVRI
jgi:hypothetical protein